MPVATLMYHDVVPTGKPDESGFPGAAPATYKIDWPCFTAHLDALDRAGIRPVAHDAEGLTDGSLLTFDDGGGCALAVARALSERGWIGHFFVTSALIDTPGFAGASDLRAIHLLGQVVGSHSHTHPPRMSSLTAEEIAGEWAQSLQVLADIVGAPVTAASVPGGYTSKAVEHAAAEAGLVTLFTSLPTTRARAVGACTVLGRYAVRTQTTPEDAVALLTGRGTLRSRQAAGWAARSISKRILRGTYPKVRRVLHSLRHR